jgi:hypothetical protein
MNKKTVISNVIVSVIVDLLFAGILIGAGVLVLLFPQIFGAVLSAAYALIGISLVLTTIPNLIGGIFSIKQKGGKFDLIFSIVTVAVGVVLAIYGIVSALIAIGISGIGLPVIIGRIMSVIRFVVCGLIALFLIVLPLIRIIKAEKKFMQLKAELVKMTFGVLIFVLLICGLVVYALNALIGISLIVVGLLAAFFALIILLVGLIGLKKADKKSPHVIEMDLNGDGIPDAIITKDE